MDYDTLLPKNLRNYIGVSRWIVSATSEAMKKWADGQLPGGH